LLLVSVSEARTVVVRESAEAMASDLKSMVALFG
jgi:hypothetical protein